MTLIIFFFTPDSITSISNLKILTVLFLVHVSFKLALQEDCLFPVEENNSYLRIL